MEPVARAILHTDHHSNNTQEPPVFVNVAENISLSWADLPAVKLVEDQQEHKSVKDQSQMNFLLDSVLGMRTFDGLFSLGCSIVF